MARQYWLIKSEPSTYPYTQLERDGHAVWDGVRSFQARNNLRAMNEGDLAFFYHSNVGKEIVAVARVVKKAYPDPTAKGEDWSVVDIEPAFVLAQPVTLAAMKADAAFAGFMLLTHSRLSVVPVSAAHYQRILKLGKTKPPAD